MQKLFMVIGALVIALRPFLELLFASKVPDEFLHAPNLSPEEEALRAPIEDPASMPGFWCWLVAIARTVATIAATAAGLRLAKLTRLMEHMPTQKIRGLTYGLNEVCGKDSEAADRDALRGPVSGKPCLYYRYKITRKFGRQDPYRERRNRAGALRPQPTEAPRWS